jgi:hypothetical protein
VEIPLPIFLIHLKVRQSVVPDDVGIEFAHAEAAYLDARASIPEMAKSLQFQGRDPLEASFLICDGRGRLLMELPFTEWLSPAE